MDGVFFSFYYYIIKLVIVFDSISFLFSLSYDDSFPPVSTLSLSFFHLIGTWVTCLVICLLLCSSYGCKLN